MTQFPVHSELPTDAAPLANVTALPYEQRLDREKEWALSEGGKFFEERSAVHQALRKIARRLDEIGVPYAVCGAMALNNHGYRRFTDDIVILVTEDGLRRIHKELSGLGFVPLFAKSKNLRDAEFGVRIEFLIAGQFPGDGKPKPVAFPDPSLVAVDEGGIKFLNLPTIIELKLSSGMTNENRLKDLADVQELIKLLKFTEEFGDQLNPFVREKFGELCRIAAAHDRGDESEFWEPGDDTP